MGTKVYANGQEVSGKASPNKVLGAMPDVCMSPPPPPAGPVPIPYPNFSASSDTTGGSKKVKMGGKEVGLKGKSSYKKCKGDEAATRNFGAGLISHNLGGPVKHKAGSFDVKVEGSGVVRFLDITTSNHTNAGDGSVGPDTAGPGGAPAPDPECAALEANNEALREQAPDCPVFATTKITYKNGRTATMATASNTRLTRHVNGLTRGPGKPAAVPGKANRYKSEICGGDQYEHKWNGVGSQPWGHSEGRMLEQVFSTSKGPKALTVAINWKKGDSIDNNPCKPYCQKALCAAKECVSEIYLCKDGQKEPLQC